MAASAGSDVAAQRRSTVSKLRRRADLAPATLELQETFALRRILLKHGQRSEDECSFVRKFLGERTTIWREPFWTLLAKTEQLKVAECVKLRMVPSDGKPHDFVVADSVSGCMIYAPLKGFAQVQCLDGAGTRLEFTPLETFGFLPVPDILAEDAMREVKKVVANPRSKVYRGEREFGERRQATSEAGKMRIKIAPGGQYLSISGAEVVPMLKKAAEKYGRRNLMKSMGLEPPWMGGGGAGGGGAGGEGGGRKREALMRDARYGVGSVLVEEGASPTSVFVIVEGECRIVKGNPRSQPSGAKTFGRSARYNLGSSQSSKLGVVLTSGFHTQVDICQLGSLGPKALIGDIPALLGGVQPVSVVAKTPLKVLQCRADKFTAHLDHNIRAKIVYVEAAKARKSRMQERGAEVERLMSLAGTPLLIDMSVSVNNGPDTAKKAPSNDHEVSDSTDATKLEKTPGRATESATASATIPTPVSEIRRVGNDPGAARGTGVLDSKAEEAIDVSNGGKYRGASRMATLTQDQQGDDTLLAESDAERQGSPQELDTARVAATASTPLLPCFSMGSGLAFREPRGTTSTANAEGALTCQRTGLATSASATDIRSTPVCGRVRPRNWPFVFSGSTRGNDWDASMGGWLASRKSQDRPEGGGTRVAVASAVAVARSQVDALFASHLTPFPTITKNRSLHAVSQPIVRHSEGFADACRGECSRSGTEAWRVSRMAKYDGLVTPVDRRSITRQIEAGFDALQGRRVSPVA